MERFLRVLLYGMMVTPLLLFSRFFFPYITSKMLVLEGLILLAALAWLISWYQKPNDYSPKPTLLLGALGTYVAITFVAALQGVNFWRSFWSTFERMDGVFTWISLTLFVIVTGAILKKREHWINLFRVSLGVSIIIALHAVQFFGLAQGKLMSPLSFYGTYGIFGNTLYLAIYSLAHIVIALILVYFSTLGVHSIKGFFSSLRNSWGYFYAAALFLNTMALLLTGNRGPLLGLFLGTLVALAWYGLSSKRRMIVAKGLGVVLVVILLVTGIFWNTDLVKRFTSLGSAASPDRLINWQVALKAFQERPLLGWGSNNYMIAQNEFYDPTLLELTRQGFDRTHNKYLEVLVDSGAIGFIAYAAIFLVAFWFLFKKRSQEPFLSAVLAGFLIAYLVQNSTVFDTPGSYLPLFLLLAFINSEFFPSPEKVKNLSPVAVVSGSLVVFFLLWQGVWQPLRANLALTQAIAVQRSTNKYEAVLAAYKKVFSYQTYGDYEAKLQLGTALVNAPEFSEELLDYGIKKIEEEQKLYSDNEVIFNVLLSKLYQSKGSFKKDSALVQKGETYIKRAIEVSPTRPETLEHYVVFLLNEGRYAQAREQLLEIKKLSDTIYNQRKELYYLGLSYYFEKNYQAAYDQLKIMVEKTGEAGTDLELIALAEAAESVGKLDEVATWYKALVDNDRRNPRNHMVLAEAYRKIGDKAKAKEEAQFALLLDPSLSEEVQKFLDTLLY